MAAYALIGGVPSQLLFNEPHALYAASLNPTQKYARRIAVANATNMLFTIQRNNGIKKIVKTTNFKKATTVGGGRSDKYMLCSADGATKIRLTLDDATFTAVLEKYNPSSTIFMGVEMTDGINNTKVWRHFPLWASAQPIVLKNLGKTGNVLIILNYN